MRFYGCNERNVSPCADQMLRAGERTKRRLAQNREAARKSRQRRKDYVQKLEAEVRACTGLLGYSGAQWCSILLTDDFCRVCHALHVTVSWEELCAWYFAGIIHCAASSNERSYRVL